MGSINPKWFFAGTGLSIFGDGSYSSNVIQGGSTLTVQSSYTASDSNTYTNCIVVTGTATVAPDGTTGASVVMCDTLIVDGTSAALKPSTNSKGLIIFAKTAIKVLNGGKINIDGKGKAGNFGNLTPWDLVPSALQAKLNQAGVAAYTLYGDGANGGAAAGPGTNINGNDGSAASTGKTGGGGSGACASGTSSGKGGKGGPCCGGGGGASNWEGSGSQPDCADYGPGGNADGSLKGAGGSGDPVGTFGPSWGPTFYPATLAGGGFLGVFAPDWYIDSGCVASADGAPGGYIYYNSYNASGGASGGGHVLAVTKAGGLHNSGTMRAAGGVNPADGGGYGKGGAGGAGCVETYEV